MRHDNLISCRRDLAEQDKIQRERIALRNKWSADYRNTRTSGERERVDASYRDAFLALEVRLAVVCHRSGVVDSATGVWYPSREAWREEEKARHALDATEFTMRADVFGVQVGYRAETDGSMVWSVVYGLTTDEPYVVERQFNVTLRKCENVERILKGTMLQKVTAFGRLYGYI